MQSIAKGEYYMIKNPTVNQRKIISQCLNLDPNEWLVRKWRECKEGIEVCLVNRESKVRYESVISK